MFRKIVIGLGIVVILFVLWALSFFFYFTRLASPEANVHFENQAFVVDINYCRPSKKERLIFGAEEDGALVPYGKYWRLGANQSTEIEFSNDVLFGGTPVESGRYRLYAIPGPETWLVRLNSELGEWGASEPDYSLDVLEIESEVQNASEEELFTISVTGEGNSATLNFHWDKTSIDIPIESN